MTTTTINVHILDTYVWIFLFSAGFAHHVSNEFHLSMVAAATVAVSTLLNKNYARARALTIFMFISGNRK